VGLLGVGKTSRRGRAVCTVGALNRGGLSVESDGKTSRREGGVTVIRREVWSSEQSGGTRRADSIKTD
jgi:hypothetical protein